MVRLPHIGSGRLVENNAELATRKQDFNAHVEGGGFRQVAGTIDMAPPLSGALAASDVQSTLENIQTHLVGSIFVTIGDGTTSFGDFTVGTVETPTVEDCFTAAFALPILAGGGVVLMKPGVYRFIDTVTLPIGVSVMGSASGTILSAENALSIGSKSMFVAPAVTSIPISVTHNSDGNHPNVFTNLMFVDNYGGPTTSISLSGTNSSFIRIGASSRIIVRDCVVIGKAKAGIDSTAAQATNAFIKLFPVYSSGDGATIDVQNCIIHGVQKAVSFLASVSNYKNTIKFNNNRVWCMFKSDNTPGVIDYAVEFTACNATLCNNLFKFQTVNTTTQLLEPAGRGVCFYAAGSVPAPYENTIDIIVTGNSLTLSSLCPSTSPGPIENQIFHIFDSLYQRAQVSNNSTGGVSDSEWYIVVGTGTNNVGDINGANALNVLSWAFSYTMGGYQVPGYYNTSDQLTIYLRPGTYYVDSSFNPVGLGAKLIGLKENESLPVIRIISLTDPTPTTGWAVDTNYMILGSHLENLHFLSALASPVRVVGSIFYGTTGSTFGNKFLAKNCMFENVGVMPRVYDYPDTVKPQAVNITFDSCRFASLLVGDYLTWSAVLLTRTRGSYYFKNCVTERGSSGSGFAGFPINYHGSYDPLNPDITIEDCDFTVANLDETGSPFFLPLIGFNSITIKNSIFDISASTARVQAVIGIFLSMFGVLPNHQSLVIDNCKIFGNDTISAYGSPAVSYGIYHFDQRWSVQITNNEISGVNVGVLNVNFSSGTEDGHNVIIKGNKHIFTSKSSTFLFFGNYDDSPSCPMNLIVSENLIDCSSSSSASMVFMEDYYVESVINCICDYSCRGMSSATIENNKIYNIVTSSTPAIPQSAISTTGFHTSRIVGNVITKARGNDKDTYAIACQMMNLSDHVIDANSSAFIKDNHVQFTSSVALAGTTVVPVFVRDIHYVNIKDNTILLPANNRNISNYIRVYSDPTSGSSYSPVIDGIIEGNTFNNTLGYAATWNMGTGVRTALVETKEILAHKESSIYDSRIKVYGNKNQKAKYDVSCTQFKKYGFDTLEYPYEAALLLKDATEIQAVSNVENLNRSPERIIKQYPGGVGTYVAGQGGQITSWNTLPSGLYYTNIWRNGYSSDPMKFGVAVWPANIEVLHSQNQILIPMCDLPKDCEILNIDIPIYVLNLDGGDAIDVETSASFIFGNATEDSATDALNYMKYMTDPPTLTLPWAYRKTNLTASQEKKILLNYNVFDTVSGTPLSVNTSTSECWMNDASTRIITKPDLYLLLCINKYIASYPSAEEFTNQLAFAIPYARITIRY